MHTVAIRRKRTVYISFLHIMQVQGGYHGISGAHTDPYHTRAIGCVITSHGDPLAVSRLWDDRTVFSLPEALFMMYVYNNNTPLACMFLDYITRGRYKIALRIAIVYAARRCQPVVYKYLLNLVPEYALESVLSAIQYCRPAYMPPLKPREYASALFCAIKCNRLDVVCDILNVFSYEDNKKLVTRAFFLSITRLRKGVFNEFIARGVDVNYPHKNTAYRVARDTRWHAKSDRNSKTLAYMQQVLLGM